MLNEKTARIAFSFTAALVCAWSLWLPSSAAGTSPAAANHIKNIGGSDWDDFYFVQQTSDGGYIAAGDSYSNDGDFQGLNHPDSDGNPSDDAILVKFDSSGSKQWVKDIGGSGYDEFMSVQQTSDGGYIAAGDSCSNDGDFQGLNHADSDGNTSDDVILVKFDSSGSKQWVKDIGGSDSDYLNSVRQTTDGGYIVVGESYSGDGDFSGLNHRDSNGNTTDDAILVKFDSSGSKQWVRDTGGSDYDYLSSVQQTSDGGYIAAGASCSDDGDLQGHTHIGNDGSTPYDAILVKFDSSGSKQWIKNIGGSGDDAFFSAQQTSDGGYIAAGKSSSNDGDFLWLLHPDSQGDAYADAILVKFDSSGSKQWVKDIGGTDWDLFLSVQQTSDGGYIAAGESYSNDGDFSGLNHPGSDNSSTEDAILVKFGSSGSKQWVKDIGGSGDEEFYSVQQTSDGGYIAAGDSFSNDGNFQGFNHTDSEGKTTDDAILVKFAVAPSAPVITNAAAGDGQVTVSFNAPAQNGGVPVTGYTVTATPVGGGTPVSVTGTQSPITVTGLQNGTAYAFTVAAANNVGTGAVSAAVNATPSKSTCIPGDVNDDGVVNSKDATILRRYIAGWNVSIDTAAADYNNDGVVNSKDSTLVRRFIAGWKVVLG